MTSNIAANKSLDRRRMFKRALVGEEAGEGDVVCVFSEGGERNVYKAHGVGRGRGGVKIRPISEKKYR